MNDQDTMGFVKSGYEWVKTQGSSLVGFFPEHIIPGLPFPVCEGCSVGDMVALGVKMSVAGVGDYWDDVDRWVRNMFAEQQLTQGDWLDRMAASMPKKPVAFNESDQQVTEATSADSAERRPATNGGTSRALLYRQLCAGYLLCVGTHARSPR